MKIAELFDRLRAPRGPGRETQPRCDHCHRFTGPVRHETEVQGRQLLVCEDCHFAVQLYGPQWLLKDVSPAIDAAMAKLVNDLRGKPLMPAPDYSDVQADLSAAIRERDARYDTWRHADPETEPACWHLYLAAEQRVRLLVRTAQQRRAV